MNAARDPLATPMWDDVDAVRFVDADAVEWRVLETDTTQVPGARAGRCLVFLSAGLARRVWIFPTDWRTLTWVELEALCGTM